MTLDELGVLLEKATPGPWVPRYTESHGRRYGLRDVALGYEDHMLCIKGSGGAMSYTETVFSFPGSTDDEANAALIAALRNEAPRLLAAARENERMREALEDFAKQKLSVDMSVDDYLGSDFADAYDHMVGLARAALKEAQT